MRRPSPVRLGLTAMVAWLLLVVIVDGLARFALGPVRLPMEPGRFVWTVFVNAALLGLLLGGHEALRRGVRFDLDRLAGILPPNEGAHEQGARVIAPLSAPVRAAVVLVGVAGGFALVLADPAGRHLYDHVPFYDPRYVLFVAQNVLFSMLWLRLIATEIQLTRAYARLGEQVRVDLLDPSPLLVFGRKGLRSVVVWASASAVFSLFWVLDSAGRANLGLAFVVIALVSTALIAPTAGVRRSLAAAKAEELAAVTSAIRKARRAIASPGSPGASRLEPGLGDLVQYQAFVRSIREWPFDLSIVSRSTLFIVLGAGSWLGGAVVERLLDVLLD